MGVIQNIKKLFVGDTITTMDTGESETATYPIEYENLPYTPLNKARTHPRVVDEYWLRNSSNRLRVSVNNLNDRVTKLEETGVIRNLYVVSSPETTAVGTMVTDLTYNFKNELEALSNRIGRDVLPICISGFDTINTETNSNRAGTITPVGWFLQGQIAHIQFTANWTPGAAITVTAMIQILVKEV